MFCTKCGTPLNEDAKFCTKCGNPVSQAAPVTPAPQVQQAVTEPPVQQVYQAPPVQQPYPQPAPVNPAPAGPSTGQFVMPAKKPVAKVMLGLMIPALILAVIGAVICILNPYQAYHNPRVYFDIRMLYQNGYLQGIVYGIALVVTTALLRVNTIPSIVPPVLYVLLGIYRFYGELKYIIYSNGNIIMDYSVLLFRDVIFLAATVLFIVAVFTKGNSKKAFGFVAMGLFAICVILSLVRSTFLFDGYVVRFMPVPVRFIYRVIPYSTLAQMLIAVGVALSSSKKKTA